MTHNPYGQSRGGKEVAQGHAVQSMLVRLLLFKSHLARQHWGWHRPASWEGSGRGLRGVTPQQQLHAVTKVSLSLPSWLGSAGSCAAMQPGLNYRYDNVSVRCSGVQHQLHTPKQHEQPGPCLGTNATTWVCT